MFILLYTKLKMKKALLTLFLFMLSFAAFSQVVVPDFENNVDDKTNPFDEVYKNFQLIIASGSGPSRFGYSKTYLVYLLQNNHWRKAIYTEPNPTAPRLFQIPIKEIATTDSSCNALYDKLINLKLFTIEDDVKLPSCNETLQIDHPTTPSHPEQDSVS